MSKSMTMTKIAGGVLSAFLVFLLGNWFASSFYSTGGESEHGEEAKVVRGYVIAPEADAAEATAEAEPEMSLNDLLLAADIERGAKAFAKCKACHKLEDGANATGPTLYGVVGRAIASVPGFGYSDALTALSGDWTPEELDAWLANPKAYAPGNKMTFKGLPKDTDRANMIAFLATQGGDGLVLDDASAAPAEVPAAMEEPATDTAEAPAAPAAPAAEAPATDTAEAPAAEPAAAPETQAEAPAAQEAAPAQEAPAATEVAMAGDPEAGAKVFKKCKACHAVESGKNKVGPSLFAVVGRDVASAEGFRFSDALKGLGGAWTPERLMEFLVKPKEYAPGTKMSFSGLRKEEDRINIVAYLETLK